MGILVGKRAPTFTTQAVLADGEILMLVGMHRSGYMFAFW